MFWKKAARNCSNLATVEFLLYQNRREVKRFQGRARSVSSSSRRRYRKWMICPGLWPQAPPSGSPPSQSWTWSGHTPGSTRVWSLLNRLYSGWLFTIKDQCKKCTFYKCTINVCIKFWHKSQDEVEGPQRAPCQLKKPVKGPKPKRGSCWEEKRNNTYFPWSGFIGVRGIFEMDNFRFGVLRLGREYFRWPFLRETILDTSQSFWGKIF